MKKKFKVMNIIAIISIITYLLIEMYGYIGYVEFKSNGLKVRAEVVDVAKRKSGTRDIYIGRISYTDNSDNDIIANFETLTVVNEGENIDIYYKPDNNKVYIVDDGYLTRILSIIAICVVLLGISCMNL